MIRSRMCACLIVFLTALGVSSAFSQMNSEEIIQRLQRQAQSVKTLEKKPDNSTRGIKLIYGSSSDSLRDIKPTSSLRLEPAVHSEIDPPAKPSITVMEPQSTKYIVVVPTIVSSATPLDLTAQPTSVNPQVSALSQSSFAPSTIDEVRPQSSDSNDFTPSSTMGSERPNVPLVADQIETYAIAPQPAAASFEAVVAAAPPDHQLARADFQEVSYRAVDEEARVDLRVFFEWNPAAPQKEAIEPLTELCAAIQSIRSKSSNRFKIIGHTDKSGAADYNLYLSTARAREVKRHLIDECALPDAALIAIGEGERQSSPTAPGQAPSERRVEIQLLI